MSAPRAQDKNVDDRTRDVQDSQHTRNLDVTALEPTEEGLEEEESEELSGVHDPCLGEVAAGWPSWRHPGL